ncbi:transcriptional regulator [Paenibacillus selenitireducens]|uniref:Transcriptional regulator n=1 Tax=Paenibacillus selenitireducens TaxID=1324314 RepID=A0A1T2X5U1_9BACL|nr:YafY family protein [Paenibacillus selenitireducens]OPA75222.1 transcriptional regulator [Paenibacillus selenitireducens]
MNKTDRLLAIVLELQRKGNLRAEDLAAKFETSVRTIYRDIQALSEAGVPIVGAPGVGYCLMEGYFLPPVSFTVEEAVTLLIGADFIEQQFDTEYGTHARTSQEKIETILPAHVRNRASQIRSSIRLLNHRGCSHQEHEKESIETIRQAILAERKIKFHYTKNIPEADGNRQSVRVVAPYGLVLDHGNWALLAHCDLRQELRHFRVSRISGLKVQEETFQFPPNFNFQNYKPVDDRTRYVRILAQPRIADQMKEANNFFMENVEVHEDGLHVNLRVRQYEEIVPWLLSWGSNVTVLEPESLRTLIRDEAEKMLKRY